MKRCRLSRASRSISERTCVKSSSAFAQQSLTNIVITVATKECLGSIFFAYITTPLESSVTTYQAVPSGGGTKAYPVSVPGVVALTGAKIGCVTHAPPAKETRTTEALDNCLILPANAIAILCACNNFLTNMTIPPRTESERKDRGHAKHWDVLVWWQYPHRYIPGKWIVFRGGWLNAFMEFFLRALAQAWPEYRFGNAGFSRPTASPRNRPGWS